ncbi:MAG: phosphopantothenoylcysteine decarboxylase, partial [Ruminococcus sp.]|nr:phosphopantothenoylcysteine decarboxylase [Ruminococcus sp.]
DVTVVTGHTEVKPPVFVNIIKAETAEDMFREVTERQADFEIIVKSAAVADYTPVTTADNKIKKSDDDMSIQLKRTKDILKYLGEHKPVGQIICGFSMETENVIENSRKKLTGKKCDMICANSLKTSGAGFGTDTNIVTLITPDNTEQLEIMSKSEVANIILTRLKELSAVNN